MATAKKQTKKDLENRIAKLEAKLNQLATQLESKPAETKPEVKKPAETTTQPPVTLQEALEDAYYTAPMTDTHFYKAKTTGYSPAPNRYFVRLHAPVGKDQKAVVAGYTQPSNQYFATRQRLAYSPPGKTFESFSGVNMSIEGIEIQT